MNAKILAIAAAMTLSGAAFAQTAAPVSTAPTASTPGMSQSGSSMGQGQNSDRATGSTAPMSPNGAPASTGKGKSKAPDGLSQPYTAPGTPNSDAAQPPSLPH